MIIKLSDMTEDQKYEMMESDAFQRQQIELSDILWEDGIEIIKQKVRELNGNGLEIDFEPEKADVDFSSQGWYFSRYAQSTYLSFTVDLPDGSFFTGSLHSYWSYGDIDDLDEYSWTDKDGEDVEDVKGHEDEIKPYLEKVKSVYDSFVNLIEENENGADYDNVVDYLIGRGTSWDTEKQDFVWNDEE